MHDLGALRRARPTAIAVPLVNYKEDGYLNAICFLNELFQAKKLNRKNLYPSFQYEVGSTLKYVKISKLIRCSMVNEEN